MNILVFGLGALGTVYSCLLRKQGHNITGIDRDFVVNEVKQQGVKVSGIWGEHSARLNQVISSLNEINDKEFDLIILTVKAYETGHIAQTLKPLIKNNTFLMLAQNGYGNYEAAAKYIAPEQIILGRVIFGAETTNPGQSKVTVIADDVILGSPPGLISIDRLEYFAEVFANAGIPTRASNEIMKYVWSKIIYNSALNPLGALLEVSYGKLGELEYTRNLMNSIIEEIFNVLAAINQPVMWKNAKEYCNEFYAKLVPTTASHHASMLQDIQRGRKTEIDALNGAVVNLGKQHGIPTPTNEFVTNMLKAKEKLNSNN